MTYGIGNPGTGLGHAQKFVRVKVFSFVLMLLMGLLTITV
jgi:hypothetical protein